MSWHGFFSKTWEQWVWHEDMGATEERSQSRDLQSYRKKADDRLSFSLAGKTEAEYGYFTDGACSVN